MNTDVVSKIIADSIVGVTFVKYLISTILVFALWPWIDRVGLTWFYVTFGLIITIIMLGNVIFIYLGKDFRIKTARKYRCLSEQRLKRL
jgi:uncharacterized membrane protein